MSNRKSKLAEVLAVLNRGRKALGKRPIDRMPTGLLDSPDQNPITRALGADFGLGNDGNACQYCGLNQGMAIETGDGKTARLLARTFETGLEEDAKTRVRLPRVLAVFAKEFETQCWPELVDHDLATVADAARELGCKAATIEDLLESGLLEAKDSCYERLISISELRRLRPAA